jgi:hypothetical protein
MLAVERLLATVEVRANALLGRRDWAFCLYPEESLRAFCTRALDSGSAGG